MSFKDMVQQDVTTVFLNMDELADLHNVNGKEAVCVLDIVTVAGISASFTMHSRNAQYTSETMMVGDRMLYIKSDFFAYPPKKEQRLDIDGKAFVILDTRENRGLMEIHLRDIRA